MNAAEPVEPAEVPWQRLHSRVVWVDAVRLLISLIPGSIATFVFELDTDSGPIWQLLIISGLGLLGSIGDLQRWMKTRYRITGQRIERRTGWLVRKYRFVPLDRVRSVDITGKLRHRLAGLRVVHIASGEADTSLKLDAVSKEAAAELKEYLLRGGSIDAPVEPAKAAPARQQTVLAELRWSWILYNLVNVWAFVGAGAFLVSLYFGLRLIGVDLLNVIRSLADWESLGLGWTIVVGVCASFVLGVGCLAVGFVTDNWNFRLVRESTEHGTALLTTKGLFNTREVYREDARLRGVQLNEPLFWRWVGLSETEVISTGLQGSLSSEPAQILPRGPISEAHRVAALLLRDGVRPLEAQVRPHPPAALCRRLFWAAISAAVIAGVLAWLGEEAIVPASTWLVGVALVPVFLAAGVVAFRSLGHTNIGGYLVVRSGVLRRSTSALQHPAVIGWELRQSLLQRWLGLMSVGVSTAAGSRFYEAPDIAADEAAQFAFDATPQLLEEFLKPVE